MDILVANLVKHFSNLPVNPPMSLRGGNAVDGYDIAPAFDPTIDDVTPEYLEAHFLGIWHLDWQSWRFYLPHLLIHAVHSISDPASNATDTFLFSLRPPEEINRALGPSSPEAAVVAVLDLLPSRRIPYGAGRHDCDEDNGTGDLPLSWLAPDIQAANDAALLTYAVRHKTSCRRMITSPAGALFRMAF